MDGGRAVLGLGEPVSYEGAGFALRECVLPLPAQPPGVPVLVAGGSRTVLRLVAEHADAANLGAAGWAGGAYGADDLAAKCALIQELCVAAGRPADAVLATSLVGVSVADTQAEAEAALEMMPPGSTARCSSGRPGCSSGPTAWRSSAGSTG